MAPDANALVVRSSTDLASLAELERVLLNDEEVEFVDDPAAMQREITAQLLGAESDEQLEAFGQAVGWQDLLDVPVTIYGFRWRPSDFDEGASVYFIADVARQDTGERLVVTTGSRNVLAQLTNLAKRERLPVTRYLAKADKATRGGFYPLWLRTPEGVDGEVIDEAELVES